MSEFVLVHDQVARQLLRIMMAGKSLDDSVFGLTWASLARGLRASAAAVGIHDAGLSGYSLRRGRRHVPFHTVRFLGGNYVLCTLAARRHGTKVHLSGSS